MARRRQPAHEPPPDRTAELDRTRGADSGATNAAGAPDELTELGRRLRELRARQGVSQSELARRAGMPRTYVIALEQGRHEPSTRLLARLSDALGRALQDYVWELAGEPYADPAAPLAARVQMRRGRLGYSQSQLADRAGVPRATISQLETGFNRNPGLFLLARVAHALRCCPSELARGLEREFRTEPAASDSEP